MREATEGYDFDKIIQNEYDDIPNELGQITYLNICSLHRLGVPVRAGLLRRLSGVSFSDFQEKLLKPCERVIVTEYDDELKEYLFRARHSHISEIVCRYALTDPEKITEIYMNILDKMDLGFNSDFYSFRELIRANSIIDSMPNINQRRYFYNKALELSGYGSYVYQQYGIMELRHNNLDEAEKLFGTACKLSPNNHAYRHSYARLLSKKSDKGKSPEQKDRLFKESQKILKSIIHEWPTNPYSYDSYAQNLIAKASHAEESQKEEYLKEAHEILLRGMRCCSNKSYLQATEAKLFQILGDYEKAKNSLLLSHQDNKISIRTALLLGRLLERNGEYPAAYKVITETLFYNELHEGLNLLAAELCLIIDSNNHNKIIGFLKRAFDHNYVDIRANYLLAVEFFRIHEYPDAEKIFRNFRQRKIYKRDPHSYDIKEFLQDENGKRKLFKGRVKTTFGKNGFIDADIIPKDIYFLNDKIFEGKIKTDTRVQFIIGFNLFGPIAQNIEFID